MDWYPIQGGVVMFLVNPCYGNWDKLQLGGPLGPSTDLTIQNDGNTPSCFLLLKLSKPQQCDLFVSSA